MAMLNGLALGNITITGVMNSSSGNAPYFACEGLGVVGGFVGREIVCGDFAEYLHCRMGVVLGEAKYSDVTGAQFAIFLGCLLALMAMLYLGINLKEKMFPKVGEVKKISPLPVPVELTKTLATKEEVQELEREVHGIKKDFNESIDKLRSEMKSDDDKLHQRVSAMSMKLATVDGKLDQVIENLKLILGKEINNR